MEWVTEQSGIDVDGSPIMRTFARFSIDPTPPAEAHKRRPQENSDFTLGRFLDTPAAAARYGRVQFKR